MRLAIGLFSGVLLLGVLNSTALADNVNQRWTEVFVSPEGLHYDVETTSLIRDGDLVYFWVRHNLDAKVMSVELAESRLYQAIDCVNGTEMQIKGYAYAPDGKLVGAGENPHPEFKPIAPGSYQQALQQYVCALPAQR